jgi:hypothetical protein
MTGSMRALFATDTPTFHLISVTGATAALTRGAPNNNNARRIAMSLPPIVVQLAPAPTIVRALAAIDGTSRLSEHLGSYLRGVMRATATTVRPPSIVPKRAA